MRALVIQLQQLTRRDSWEINVGLGSAIEIVREYVQRDMRDDLNDLSIGKTRCANAIKIVVTDAATTLDDRSGELQCGGGLRVR